MARELSFEQAMCISDSHCDPSIETAQIAARIEQGVVTLNLPKAERVKPRKISVS